MDFATVKKICQDYTLFGLKTIQEAREEGMEPLRFVYVSGAATERDQSRRPSWMPEYSLMRVSLFLSLSFSVVYLSSDIDSRLPLLL